MNLTDRLPPSIATYDRWRELFEAIDEYWEESLAGPIQRLKNIRSVFTASEDDLDLMLEELTSFFDDASDELSKPLSIFWKRNEINSKNSEAAVEALLQRINITADDIKYKPLYAAKDGAPEEYGTYFYTEEDLEDMEADLSDYFVSSHMSLEINLHSVLRHGWDKNEINDILLRYFEENVRPTHIVYDGLNFFIHSECDFKNAIGVQSNRVSVCITKEN